MSIYDEIIANCDEKYANFSHKLIPNVDRNKIIGIRMPMLKKIAKKYANTQEGEVFLNSLPHKSVDENTIHGLIIGYLKKDINIIVDCLDKFLPHIDNWATCDATVANLKIFKSNLTFIKPIIIKYIETKKDYYQRFGIVCMLTYFLDDNFKEEDLYFLALVNSDNYYVNMALAWYFSVAMVKQKDVCVKILKQQKIKNIWVHNKAIQKCCESFRIDEKTKKYLKTLKI